MHLKYKISILCIAFSTSLSAQKAVPIWSFGFSSVGSVNQLMKIEAQDENYFQSRMRPGLGLKAHINVAMNSWIFSFGAGIKTMPIRFDYIINEPFVNSNTGATIYDFYHEGILMLIGQEIWLGSDYKILAINKHRFGISYSLRLRKIQNYLGDDGPIYLNSVIGMGQMELDSNGEIIGPGTLKIIHDLELRGKNRNNFLHHSIGITYRYGKNTSLFLAAFYNYSRPFAWGQYSFPIVSSEVAGKVYLADTGMNFRVGLDILIGRKYVLKKLREK